MTLKQSTHSIAQAAKILGIGRDTCKQAVEAGQIPSIQIGRRRRIPKRALKSLLDATAGAAGKA